MGALQHRNTQSAGSAQVAGGPLAVAGHAAARSDGLGDAPDGFDGAQVDT